MQLTWCVSLNNGNTWVNDTLYQNNVTIFSVSQLAIRVYKFDAVVMDIDSVCVSQCDRNNAKFDDHWVKTFKPVKLCSSLHKLK